MKPTKPAKPAKSAKPKKTAKPVVKAAKPVAKTPASGGSDRMKWWLVLLVLVVSIVADIYFDHFPSAIRLGGVIIAVIIMMLIAMRTSQGKRGLKYLQESRNEVRRVIWPTRQATLQVTMVVALMVLVVALAIFAFDQVVMLTVGWITG